MLVTRYYKFVALIMVVNSGDFLFFGLMGLTSLSPF